MLLASFSPSFRIIPLLLLTYAPLESLGCMSTTSSSSSSSGACAMDAGKCPGGPGFGQSVLLDVPSSAVNYNVGELGTCSCQGTSLVLSEFLQNTANVVTQAPYGIGVNCPTLSNTCVCDVNCNCYSPYGTTFDNLATFPYCDAGGCFLYLAVLCSTPDPTSGLQNIATGAQVSCASQYSNTATLTPATLGSSSPYIKAVFIGCSGCSSTTISTLNSCVNNLGTFSQYLGAVNVAGIGDV